ncbi:MAG: AEC family transporter [Butyrivibrio sp.]|nr:AEC family transporter [Butyrivibrio sp.]
MILVQQMIVLFLIMGVGFLCGKKSFISDENAKNLSWIVVNIATPGMILSAGMNEESTIRGSSLLFGFLVTISVYVFLIAVSFVIIPVLKVPQDDKNVYRVMTIFSNVGFIGLPLLQATYGPEAVLYGALFQFPYNILMYTYGIAAMKGENPFKGGNPLKRVVNVGIISSVLAIVIYVSGIHMPSFISVTAKHLSSLAAPLSMMVIGQSMASIKIKELFGDARLFIFSLLKLVIAPITGILLLGLFVDDKTILRTCYIMLATPIGSMTAMVAQQYGGNYTLASRGVALSTLLSVVTIPLISTLIAI